MTKGWIHDRFFYPGPVDVDLETHLSGITGPLYHRHPDFLQAFQECRERLRQVFQCNEKPLILTASGTGAMETAIRAVSCPHDLIVHIDAGKFGERWGVIAKELGREVTTIKFEWGHTVEPLALQGRIPSSTQAVFLQATETSTALRLPVEELTQSIRTQAPGAFIIVDAVSSAIAEPLKMEAWDVDGMISGSQKGFGIPPGLSFLALSKRAWAYAATSDANSFYLNAAQEKAAQDKGSGSWTTATSLVKQLHRTLVQFENIGYQTIHHHHQSMTHMVRCALRALRLELLVEDDTYAARGVTAFRIPQGSHIQKKCKNMGIHLAGGQGALQGRILRIAHLGLSDPWNLISALQSLELALYEEGHLTELGRASEICLRHFAQHNAARSQEG